MRFAQSIGFEKVLADDIVRPDDVKFDWGYREDIFFCRAFMNICRSITPKTGCSCLSTRAPQTIPHSRYWTRIFWTRSPSSIRKGLPRIIQYNLCSGRLLRAILRHLQRALRVPRFAGSRNDHAWPIMMHKDNIYNERGAYEENFLIPLLFVPPSSMRDHFAVGATFNHRFSQMDIYPTVLELIGMEHQRLLGESFAPWLLRSPSDEPAPPQKTKICVQPYGGGFISAVRYPQNIFLMCSVAT